MKTGAPYVVPTIMILSVLIPVIAAMGLAPTEMRTGSAEDATPPSLNQIDPPATDGSFAPNLCVSGDRAILSWLETVETDPAENRSFRLRFAFFENSQWSPPRTIIEDVEFFANWADVPSVAIARNGTLLAHWLEKSGPGTFAYDVRLARSTDEGETWHLLGPAHNDGTKTEHGFVSLVPESEGVRAFWLDGRNMTSDEEDEDEDEEETDESDHGNGSMTLRTALVTDQVTQGMLLDGRICECCGTSAAMTSKGPLIAYRDRDYDETRDIWFVRYDGMEWTSPAPVHVDGWKIVGCPVNGPAVDAKASRVVVAWYTQAGNQQEIRVAFSDNDGATFSEPVIVDPSGAMGRVDVVFDDSGEAIICWLDSTLMAGAIVACRVSPDGNMGKIITLAGTSTARSSGFPKLGRVGDALLLIWTEDSGPLKVRAATMRMSDIPSVDTN